MQRAIGGLRGLNWLPSVASTRRAPTTSRPSTTSPTSGGTLAVDYNYRHMPSFARIAQAFETVEIGVVIW